MKIEFVITFCLGLGVLAGCADGERSSALQTSTAAATPPVQFELVGSNKQIMQAITIPASDVLFAIGDEPPASDEAWLAIENAAVALAESGNLLLMPGRSIDAGDWTRYSHELIDKTKAALDAARAKSVDGVLAAGDELYVVCENCHKQYMPQG